MRTNNHFQFEPMRIAKILANRGKKEKEPRGGHDDRNKDYRRLAAMEKKFEMEMEEEEE